MNKLEQFDEAYKYCRKIAEHLDEAKIAIMNEDLRKLRGRVFLLNLEARNLFDVVDYEV